jgi:ABC-type nitrate/sulfonate/bicarbonate transport system permease component
MPSPTLQRDGSTVGTTPRTAKRPWEGISGRISITGLLLLALLAAAWELTVRTGAITSPSLPSFSEVVRSFLSLTVDGTFAEVFFPTLRRLFVGYALAVLAGVGVGLLMGFFRRVFALLSPLVEILRPIPAPAYIPIAILFLGIDDAMKLFVITLTAFFPILLNTIAGVRNVDPILKDTGRTFGLGQRELLSRVVLPGAATYIATGMRVSLATALIMTVISEMVAGNSGIGYFILDAQSTFRVTEMYSGVLALALVGFALNALFVLTERRVLRWSHQSKP